MNSKLFIKCILSIYMALSNFISLSQTYEIQFGDTINRTDKNSLKQGLWVEKTKDDFFWKGNYKNNLRIGGWAKYDKNGNSMRTHIYFHKESKSNKLIPNFEFDGEFNYKQKKKREQFFVTSNTIYNEKNDSNIYIRILVNDKSFYSTTSNEKFEKPIDSVKIEVIEIEPNQIIKNINNAKLIGKHYTTISKMTSGNMINTRLKEPGYYPCTLKSNKEYLIIFSKEKYLTYSIIFNTQFDLDLDFKLRTLIIPISMTNRIIDTKDPFVAGYPSKKIIINDFGRNEDDKNYNIMSNILQKKDDYDIKKRIIELENVVNEELTKLKYEQEKLESQKKLKEEELRHQQEEIKRNQLELELLAKDKAVSALTIKAKEAELLKNMLLANEKKKEIERLNQQKLIDELSIKNKESEIAKKNIEAENKQKQIHGLEKEKELSNENLKKQKFIQKLIIAGSGLLGVFLLFVFFSLAKSRKANKLIAAQKHLVEEKQKEILDSINYAKRLQEAILPPLHFINEHAPNNFVLYQPKDVVAGDFYWAEIKDDKFFIAAADSTGHGVPGAMVSVVCSNALNRTVNEFGITDTGKILDKTRELVLETFAKGNSEVKDGMDISLLCIDKSSNKVYWSGANNPLWYVKSSVTSSAVEKLTDEGLDSARPEIQLIEIKADKQPIGKSEITKPFTAHEIALQDGMQFYLFTDGFADQFGGPKGKKFMYKQLEDLLISISHESMEIEKQKLENVFKNWKGDLEQVDDVCVIGVRV